MADLPSSDDLEEENIFQKARVSNSRKRTRSPLGGRVGAPSEETRAKKARVDYPGLSKTEQILPSWPALHTISLSPTLGQRQDSIGQPDREDSEKHQEKYREYPPPPNWTRPSTEPLTLHSVLEAASSKGVDPVHSKLPPAPEGHPVLPPDNNQRSELVNEISETRFDDTPGNCVFEAEQRDPGHGIDHHNDRDIDYEHVHTIEKSQTGHESDLEISSELDHEPGQDSNRQEAHTSEYLSSDLGSELAPNALDVVPAPVKSSKSQETSLLHTQTVEELVSKLMYIEVPILDRTEPAVKSDIPLSRAGKIKFDNIMAGVGELRRRIEGITKSIGGLHSTVIAVPRTDEKRDDERDIDEVIRQLWQTSFQLGRLSGLKIQAKQAQRARLQLMQEIVEMKYSAGVGTASEKAYDQLRLQIESAREMLATHPGKEEPVDDLKSDVESLRQEFLELDTTYRAKEEEFRLMSEKDIDKIRSFISSKQSDLPENDETDHADAMEQELRRNCAHLGAELTIQNDHLFIVSMLYMKIYIDAGSGNVELDFSYPNILRAVYTHYEKIIKKGSKSRPIRETLRIWNQCLKVEAEFAAMLGYGPYELTSQSDGNVLIFTQTHIRRDRRIFVRLQGLQITIGEKLTDLRDLPPLRKLANLFI